MKKDEFLSVKEVADYAGVTVQAVYNRLEKDFKPFLKIENGKKRLNRAVLEVIKSPEISSDFKSDFKSILNLLERQNTQLQRELDLKNKQIEDLSAALLAAQQTAQAAQALHAGTIHKQLTDGGADPSETTEAPPKKKWWKFWK